MTGGVFEPRHNFSLVNQDIRVRSAKDRSDSGFRVKFPNIWDDYKLPKISQSEIYDLWLSNQMQFWQNQLNFSVWCATTGCNVGKDLLNHDDPMIRSVFRFHTYYQIRRILSEMSVPLPTESSFDPLNNGINKNAFQRICSEFGISPRSNFRQKFDYSNGMGSFYYYAIKRGPPITKTLTAGGNYNKRFAKGTSLGDYFIPGSGRFGAHDSHTYKIEYLQQNFDHDPGITDLSIRKGDHMAAIGSFVQDQSLPTTNSGGVTRINDSIRTYVWAILGSQAQTRSTIIGSGRAFDAQKQFLANVEDAINSAVDIPSSISRYQKTLQYAQSKLDFVVGHGLYLLPSNMELLVGNLNGYNNLIQVATSDMKIGFNESLNRDFASQKDFALQNLDHDEDFALQNLSKQSEVEVEDIPLSEDFVDQNLSHEEKILAITIGGIAFGLLALYFR